VDINDDIIYSVIEDIIDDAIDVIEGRIDATSLMPLVTPLKMD